MTSFGLWSDEGRWLYVEVVVQSDNVWEEKGEVGSINKDACIHVSSME